MGCEVPNHGIIPFEAVYNRIGVEQKHQGKPFENLHDERRAL